MGGALVGVGAMVGGGAVGVGGNGVAVGIVVGIMGAATDCVCVGGSTSFTTVGVAAGSGVPFVAVAATGFVMLRCDRRAGSLGAKSEKPKTSKKATPTSMISAHEREEGGCSGAGAGWATGFSSSTPVN